MYHLYCHKTYNYGEYRHAEIVKNIKEEDDPHKLGDRKPEICNQKRPNIRSIYQRVQHPIMVPQIQDSSFSFQILSMIETC